MSMYKTDIIVRNFKSVLVYLGYITLDLLLNRFKFIA